MKARTIGGIGFVLIFYATLLMGNAFLFLLSIFFVVGIHELVGMIKKTDVKLLNCIYGLIFVSAIVAMGYLSLNNIPFLIYITAVLMLDDTMAYFVGKKFGKHKLSSISPNKTIEGSLGGFLLSPFLSILVLEGLGRVFQNISVSFLTFDVSMLINYNSFNSIITLIFVSFGIAVLGQLGDLMESYFKRHANIKDSGTFVYGHGGILDRIDSWLMTMIVMALIIAFL